jgi:hypothetical protein
MTERYSYTHSEVQDLIHQAKTEANKALKIVSVLQRVGASNHKALSIIQVVSHPDGGVIVIVQ